MKLVVGVVAVLAMIGVGIWVWQGRQPSEVAQFCQAYAQFQADPFGGAGGLVDDAPDEVRPAAEALVAGMGRALTMGRAGSVEVSPEAAAVTDPVAEVRGYAEANCQA